MHDDASRDSRRRIYIGAAGSEAEAPEHEAAEIELAAGDLLVDMEQLRLLKKINKRLKGMSDTIVTGAGDGMGLGGGIGGGLLGGILGGALLGGGLGVNRVGNFGSFEATQLLANQLNGLSESMNSNLNAVNQGLSAALTTQSAGITAAVNSANQNLGNIMLCQDIGAVRAAISASTADINGNINNLNTANLQGQAGLQQSIAANTFASVSAAKDAQAALAAAIRDDGDKTRALLTEQYTMNLQRELGVAQAALSEERNAGRVREVEVNVSQTVSQNQAQLQLQAQQQQQFQLLAQLTAGINNLANDIQAVRQTQSNINFGTQAGVGQSAQATNNRVS